jgi:hypothetical protein
MKVPGKSNSLTISVNPAGDYFKHIDEKKDGPFERTESLKKESSVKNNSGEKDL